MDCGEILFRNTKHGKVALWTIETVATKPKKVFLKPKWEICQMKRSPGSHFREVTQNYKTTSTLRTMYASRTSEPTYDDPEQISNSKYRKQSNSSTGASCKVNPVTPLSVSVLLRDETRSVVSALGLWSELTPQTQHTGGETALNNILEPLNWYNKWPLSLFILWSR